MVKYEYISKEWIVSLRARRVYRVSAALSIALFSAILFVGGIPLAIAPLVKLLLFAGVLGAAITLVGMEFFLFRFDDSHPLKQVVWFLLMLLPLLGAPLYCLLVYSRSNVLKSSYAERIEGAPL
jgi:hypothetical protein